MASGLLPNTERALLYRVAVAQWEGRAPSLAAGVVRDGALVWSGSRGQVDEEEAADSAYRIGSITKTFTAVLIMQLRDEGRVSLLDPIDQHLPEVEYSPTIAQLLSHTSGLTSELPGEWWERVDGTDFAGVVTALTGQPARLAAGSRLHYSNVGFALLGEIVTRLRQSTWADTLQRRVLAPLGMTRTGVRPTHPHLSGWAVHPHADVLLREPAADTNAMGPAGQLWSTVADLARWVEFLNGNTGDVLRADTLQEMQQPASVADGSTWTTGYGLGLQLSRVDGRRRVGHGGSMPGFVAALWAEPDTQDGAVALANATSGVDVGDLAHGLLGDLARHEPAWPRPWTPRAVDPALLELTGTWYSGPTPFVLVIEGQDVVRLIGAGFRVSRFRPEGDGTWTGLDNYYAGERLRVIRGSDGHPDHLNLATFVLTRRPYDDEAATPGGIDPRGWHSPTA